MKTRAPTRLDLKMIRTDDNHLLMIEPKSESVPIQDVWTRRAMRLLFMLKKGKQWRGMHSCICGATSEPFDLITPQGRITNSLLAHYVECHRSDITHPELAKLYAEIMNWSTSKALENMEGGRRAPI